ncbi:hypothetical protein RSOLAG22IIIB_12435 [Rhizoctonia solani]|uniref:Uncharacterized protein n=1 Tax=Rhizoctonia solani TaxID=456999 RepID=A0A0K6GE45_9AGAM|nr:hypothetical protein RSOLAG22IIIB_12435 [Rhizoctonia solani]
MFNIHTFGSVQPRRASGDRARASKAYPSSAISVDATNIYSRSAKEVEHLAEQALIQARSRNKLQGTLVGYDFLESSQHKRPSDLKIPTKPSSDIFSPPIPTSPLPEYSYPPQYSPPRRSKELPKEATPEPQRRTPTRPAPREVPPPPKYHKEDVVDLSDFYSVPKPRSAGRALPRSKPIDTFDCNDIYSLVEDHALDTTPPKPGRLALAASRESRSSKKQFESHKRQTRNHIPSHTEELDNDPELDDLSKSILGDIAAIGSSSSRHAANRGAFHHALNAERPQGRL